MAFAAFCSSTHRLSTAPLSPRSPRVAATPHQRRFRAHNLCVCEFWRNEQLDPASVHRIQCGCRRCTWWKCRSTISPRTGAASSRGACRPQARGLAGRDGRGGMGGVRWEFSAAAGPALDWVWAPLLAADSARSSGIASLSLPLLVRLPEAAIAALSSAHALMRRRPVQM